MNVCPLCGETLPEEARFCPADGNRLIRDEDPYIGTSFMEQFEIQEICGRGSMGTVYKAWQSTMDREVAVKVLHKDLLRDDRVVKRFHREARAVARLSHPNIIMVFLVGDTADGVPFLAMEYVRGKSLDATCREEGSMPTVRSIHIAHQITSALAEAHSRGIVHRDLKPENILLTNRPQQPDFVKVLDFGIAKIIWGDEESHLTQTGAIFGTPFYLSPEQAAGGDVDHRCDLYALGVILFRMVTGRLPFQSDSGMGVLVQHLKEKPPRPRSLNKAVPLPLERLILKALQKEPDERFQSAMEMSEALDLVVDHLRAGTQTMQRGSGPGLRSGQHQALLKEPAAEGLPDQAPGRPEVPSTLEVSRSGSQQAASGPAQTEPEPPGSPALVADCDVQRDPLTPTVLDLGSSPRRATRASGARSPVEPAAVRLTGTDLSTMNLAGRVLGQRRWLVHLVVGLGSILGGSALGAALHYYGSNGLFKGAQDASRPREEPGQEVVPEPPPGWPGAESGETDRPAPGTALPGPGGAGGAGTVPASPDRPSVSQQSKPAAGAAPAAAGRARGRAGKGPAARTKKAPRRGAPRVRPPGRRSGDAADRPAPAGTDPGEDEVDEAPDGRSPSRRPPAAQPPEDERDSDHGRAPDPPEESPPPARRPPPAEESPPPARRPPPAEESTPPAKKPSPAKDDIYDMVD